MSGFVKASKAEARGRVAIAGPSGSGKTYTGLIWATTIADGGGVAVIDTERGSAVKYADLFDFDVQRVGAPYHPDKLMAALAESAEAGYAVTLIDSLSHFWSGQGGVLEIVDDAKSRFKGNSHAAWQVGTPLQQRMVDAVLTHPGHIIAAMRSKTEWLMQEGPNGKTQPIKVGLAPQQRDGIEYEFDLMLDIDLEHRAAVGKTRFAEFTDRSFQKGDAEDAARTFAKWLTEGEPLAPLDETAAIDLAIRALDDAAKTALRAAWKSKKLPSDLGMLTVSQAEAARALIELEALAAGADDAETGDAA